jgi:hypothetical protein
MGCAIFGDENLERKNQEGIGVLLSQNSPTQRAHDPQQHTLEPPNREARPFYSAATTRLWVRTLRSLMWMPPTISYWVESSPKTPLMALGTRLSLYYASSYAFRNSSLEMPDCESIARNVEPLIVR